MTHIRCKGNKEIDLLAINPKTLKKYHVESRVSTAFTLRSHDTFSNRLGDGVNHRDGINFFHESKFEHENVKEKIREIFGKEPYERILVVYDVKDDSVITIAEERYGIRVLLISDIISDLKEEVKVSGSRDDVIRFVELISLKEKEFYDDIESLLKKLEKESGLRQLGIVKRYSKLRKMKKAEVFKTLGIDKKTSTQRLRESLK